MGTTGSAAHPRQGGASYPQVDPGLSALDFRALELKQNEPPSFFASLFFRFLGSKTHAYMLRSPLNKLSSTYTA